jgi:hypothetical protein
VDPQEWQRLADQLAVEVREALDQLERDFWPEPSDPSFRSFWPRIRALSERVRTAPAIDIEDKLQLQARMRALSRRAREQQQTYFEAVRAQQQALLDQIEALRGQAAAATAPAQVQQVRQGLEGVRVQFSSTDLPSRRSRQEIWNAWQSANQYAWSRLTELWAANEAALEAVLDQAQSRLDTGDVRGTRELIKRFNTLLREQEVSYKRMRALRARANALWRQAAEVARAKHEMYLTTAEERLEQWKATQGRHARVIARLRAEIAELQGRPAETEVAAAFTRALIEEKQRALEQLEAASESLDERIEQAEAALSSVG